MTGRQWNHTNMTAIESVRRIDWRHHDYVLLVPFRGAAIKMSLKFV